MIREAAAAAAGLLALGACSSGGHESGTGASAAAHDGPCALITRLDDIANGASSITLADPEASKRALDDAVSRYVSTLHELRSVVPADVAADVERVQADVQQFRFNDALVDRASLDTYARTNCGRTAAPPTSSPTSTPTTESPG